MLFRLREVGRRVGIGANQVVEPILETIPAHEATKFTLRVEPGMVIEEAPEKLTGELYLRVGKYWDSVGFTLHRVSTGDFYLDAPIAEYSPWLRVPWWKRAARRLQRLV